MTWAQQFLLNGFIHSLAGVPWFDHCGEPDPEAVIAGDLVEAWDDWGSEMMAVWSPQTHALEKTAVGALGEGGVDAIFAAVSKATETPLREGAFRYFERRPADSEIAEAGVDEGLWPGPFRSSFSWTSGGGASPDAPLRALWP